MFAANLSPVPILGTAIVSFTVARITLQHKFLVSNVVDDIFFGCDWLVENRCHWDFENRTLLLRSTSESVQVQLIGAGMRQCVRCIYAGKSGDLQPGFHSDVNVQAVWTSLPNKATEWIVEPKELHQEVIMARTLLSGDDETVKVRVIQSRIMHRVSWRIADDSGTSRHPLTADEIATTDSSDTNLQCLIDSLRADLTVEQHRQGKNFLKSYSLVFFKSTSDLGRNQFMPHRINTSDHPPVKQQLGRQPYAYLPEIERNVQDLCAAKVFEPAQSPWSSNV